MENQMCHIRPESRGPQRALGGLMTKTSKIPSQDFANFLKSHIYAPHQHKIDSVTVSCLQGFELKFFLNSHSN